MGDVVELALRLRDEASRPLSSVATAADKTAAATVRAERAMVAASAGASKMGRSIQAVAIQLPDVASQLSMGVPPMQIFAQQGLQVGQSLMMIMGAGASLLPVLGGITAAAAAAGAAYVVWRNVTEQVNAAHDTLIQRLADATDEVSRAEAAVAASGKSWQSFRRAVEDASRALDVALKITDARDEAARRQIRALEDQSRAAILAAAREVVALEAQRDAAHEVAASMEATVTERVRAQQVERETTAQLEEATARLRERKAELERGKQAIRDRAEVLREEAHAEEVLRDRTRAGTAALRDQAEAAREATASIRELFSFLAGETTRIGGGESFVDEMISAGREAGEAAGEAQTEAMTAHLRAGLSEAAVKLRQWTAEQAAAAAATLRQQQAILSGTVSLAGGSPESLLTTAGAAAGTAVGGPLGGAVGGAGGQLVAELASSGGAAEVADTIADTIVSVADALPELVELLVRELPIAIVEALPRILWDLLVELPKAILVALREWWRDAMSGLRDLFSVKLTGKDGWFARAGEAITDAVKTLGHALGFARGGYVPRTGLAVVHAGERILRAGGPDSQTVQQWAGGGGTFAPVIQAPVLTPDAIRPIVRELERVYGSRGLRSSRVL